MVCEFPNNPDSLAKLDAISKPIQALEADPLDQVVVDYTKATGEFLRVFEFFGSSLGRNDQKCQLGLCTASPNLIVASAVMAQEARGTKSAF